MKRVMIGISVLIFSFCVLVGHGLAANVVLRSASPWPINHPINKTFFKFGDMVEKESNGSIKIKWAGGPELFKARDLSTAAATGSIDVFHSPCGYLGGKVPEAGIYDGYPGGRNFRTIARVQKEAVKFLGPIIEKKLKVKPFGGTTFFNFFLWLKKPAKKFEELKGLKIRVHGGLAPHLVRALGMTVVTMPSTDVYMALERGVIEGALRNLSSFNKFREYEFCKFGINIPLHVGGTPIFISLKKWDKLDDMQKKVFSDTTDEITDISAKHWEMANNKMLGGLKANGVTLYDPSPEFKAKWERLMAEGGKKAARKLSPKNADKVIGIIEKYSK